MMGKLEASAVEEITQRLSGLPDLHLPFALSSQGDSISQADKKAHLFDLLHRDAAIFLERHGSKLSIKELNEFDALNGVYEVEWHLKRLKNSLSPASAKEQKAHASLVKNRRLAFMDRLIQDGDFFSEDAMKMRAPLLYHEYLGQFQDPSEKAFARPGERWSDMLIRQGEEAEYQARLKTEREKAGIQVEKVDHQYGIQEEEEEEEEEDDDEDEQEEEKEEEEEEEQEEEEEEEEEAGKKKERKEDLKTGLAGCQIDATASESHGGSRRREAEIHGGSRRRDTESHIAALRRGDTELSFEERQQLKLEKFTRYMQEKFFAQDDNAKPSISGEEMQCKMDDFTRIMQEKFLSGEDSEHFDYVHIDHDTALDDYWLEEMSQDAEDKYFEED